MYSFGRSSRYHPNSPDAFLAAPFVQPTNFSITIHLSSSAPVVPEPAQASTLLTETNAINKQDPSIVTSADVKADEITNNATSSNSNPITDAVWEASSRTIQEQCTMSQQNKDAIINTAMGITTATMIAENIDEDMFLGVGNILFSGLKMKNNLEKIEQNCIKKLEEEGASTNVTVSFPTPRI